MCWWHPSRRAEQLTRSQARPGKAPSWKPGTQDWCLCSATASPGGAWGQSLSLTLRDHETKKQIQQY